MDGKILLPVLKKNIITCDFLGTTTENSGLTSLSFTSQPLGAGALDRWIVACLSQANSASTISSSTIDGIAATTIAQAAGTTSFAGMVIAKVPNGDTTGTIAFTMSAATGRTGLSIYRLTRMRLAAAYKSGTAVNGNLTDTVNLDDLALGCIIGHGGNVSSSNSAIWNGFMTSDVSAISGGANGWYGSAHGLVRENSHIARPISLVWGIDARNAMVVASFQ